MIMNESEHSSEITDLIFGLTNTSVSINSSSAGMSTVSTSLIQQAVAGAQTTLPGGPTRAVLWALSPICALCIYRYKAGKVSRTRMVGLQVVLSCLIGLVAYGLCSGATSWYQKELTTIEPSEVFAAASLLVISIYLFSSPISFGSERKATSTYENEETIPELNASFLSRLTFFWCTSLYIKGYRIKLGVSDLWQVPSNYLCEQVAAPFLQRWNKHFSENRPHVSAVGNGLEKTNGAKKSYLQAMKRGLGHASLFASVVLTRWTDFALAIFLRIIMEGCSLLQPQLLQYLLSSVADCGELEGNCYVIAGLMFLLSLSESFLCQHYITVHCFTGWKTRISVMSSVYRKALRITPSARAQSTVGEIVNLIGSDSDRFFDLVHFANALWAIPLKIVVSLYFLWDILGASVLAGFAALLLILPINAVIIAANQKLEKRFKKLKDARLKMMNEILSGIKVLKLYAWETSFEEKITQSRIEELEILKKKQLNNVIGSFLNSLIPEMVSLLSFAAYVMSSPDNVLTAEKAFVSLSFFNILRGPIAELPGTFNGLLEISVANSRIATFLNRDEINNQSATGNSKDEDAISIRSGSFSWARNTEPTLKDISLSVAPGSLVAVVGAVGSGKSSLLSALLGEMETVSGDKRIKASVAYVPQQPWVQHATLRDNVLFHSALEQKFYDRVIRDCGLIPDLKILPQGDMTEIGERGINLSGGQKIRVTLARAVYNMADIYLLDDPLSAVDVHVGKHIFQNILGPQGILKDKTRILVTHGVSFLPYADHIVVMKDGRVSETGSFQQLVNRKGPFAEFLSNYYSTHEEGQNVPLKQDESMKQDQIAGVSDQDRCVKSMVTNDNLQEKSRDAQDTDADSECTTTPSGDKDCLVEDETVETGNIKLSVYTTYFRAIGVRCCLFVVFLVSVHVAFDVLSSVWLADWTKDSTPDLTHSNITNAMPMHNTEFEAERRNMRIAVFGATNVLNALFSSIAFACGLYACRRTSRVQHKRLLHNVLAAGMTFFDTTPTGRLLNRFGSDVESMDRHLPWTLLHMLKCVFGIVGSIVMLGIAIPWSLSVWAVLSIVYLLIQRAHANTTRQIRRLCSVTHSPIYAHFSETLGGVSTIRAYGHQKHFIKKSEALIDDHHRAVYARIMLDRVTSLILNVMADVLVLVSTSLAIYSRDVMSVGFIGLIITMANNVTRSLESMVHQSAAVEDHIISVERIKEFSETKPEAPRRIPENKPKASWPDSGHVTFTDYCARYREGQDLVLKGLTADIAAGEKVGIVGRTGAGKSSLTLALFRIIEAAGGSIHIDGVDVSKIGLHDLRSRLTIIPQDPVLLSGTLRMNLDPFDEYTDERLWEVLRQAHLSDFIKTLTGGLQFEFSEGGENLSVGQRQLICLARALLRHTRVLILDEATAAVDMETDDLIQNTLRTVFSDCTVLTIAHRLNTILDYTKIMVLDAGRVIEFDTPDNLLSDTSSTFHKMVRDSGSKH